MPSSGDIYTAPASEVTYELVRKFVVDAEEADLFSESLTFEVKERRDRNNVAEAVAALSNTDGGVVLVGVKDKDARGEARLVGVPKAEHDALASSLHNVIHEAIPEIIPVVIPDTDRLIIVLRVDADSVAHPVMVSGKVLYRIPGHTVPADRARVLDLVRRDSAGAAAEQGTMDVPAASWEPFSMSLPSHVPEEHRNSHAGLLQVAGGLILPRRMLDRPWLDSRARQAALAALDDSPLSNDPAWRMQPWRNGEARATYLRYYTSNREAGSYPVRSEAGLNLSGRRLSMALGFQWLKKNSRSSTLSPEHCYVALLESIVSIASVCRQVARAIDAAEPTDPDFWEGRLQSSPPIALPRIVDLARFSRDGTRSHDAGHLPRARTSGTGIADLDELARNWLTYWLLDMGMRDFEDWLAALERPLIPLIPGVA